MKSWNVLFKHVPSLTVKSLPNIHWKSQMEIVTTTRYQATELRSALFELHHAFDVEHKDRSDANLFMHIGSLSF
jgi:hypothetical protein